MRKILIALAAVLIAASCATAQVTTVAGTALGYVAHGAYHGQTYITGYAGAGIKSWHEGNVKLFGIARKAGFDGGPDGYGGGAILVDQIFPRFWGLVHGGAIDNFAVNGDGTSATAAYGGAGILYAFGHALHGGINVDFYDTGPQLDATVSVFVGAAIDLFSGSGSAPRPSPKGAI